jgi:hypothetical protein
MWVLLGAGASRVEGDPLTNPAPVFNRKVGDTTRFGNYAPRPLTLIVALQPSSPG